MKLFTNPRPLYPRQLRPGDQIATVKKGGALIRSEVAYFDADLAGQIVWSVVHHVNDGTTAAQIVHTLGEHEAIVNLPVMTREAVHLDPWSYVSHEPHEDRHPEAP